MTRLFSNPWRLTVVPVVALLLLTISVIAAQRSIRASYVLQVDVSELNRLCIGQTIQLPVTVALGTVEFAGEGSVGSLTVRSAVVTPVVDDPSIVRVVQSDSSVDLDPGSPSRAHTYLEIAGTKFGSTTLRLSAAVSSSILRSLDEEVMLPIPITDPADPISVPVRVVPCNYQVDVGTVWVTSLFSANVIVSAVSYPIFLISDNGRTFDPEGPALYRLSITSNRFSHCDPTNTTFHSEPLRVRGQVLDDRLNVTIEYPLPAYSRYELGCIGSLEPRVYRERGEFPLSPQQQQQNFIPQRLDISVPLNGGTVTLPHRVEFRSGGADSAATITITPIRPLRPR